VTSVFGIKFYFRISRYRNGSRLAVTEIEESIFHSFQSVFHPYLPGNKSPPDFTVNNSPDDLPSVTKLHPIIWWLLHTRTKFEIELYIIGWCTHQVWDPWIKNLSNNAT